MREEYFDAVLPFLCSSVLVMNENYTSSSHSNERRISEERLLLERWPMQNIDRAATRLRMANFKDKATCGHGMYTKDRFISQVKQRAMTQLDLLNYAGYTRRYDLVRFCTFTDPMNGLKRSCANDSFWSPPSYDDQFGVCHSLNPCHGFEDGKPCDSDADCKHEHGVGLAGAKCSEEIVDELSFVKEKRCRCELCKAGKDCQLLTHGGVNIDAGVKLVLNADRRKDPVIYSMQKAKVGLGASIFLHSRLDSFHTTAQTIAGPGKSTHVEIGREMKKERNFPYTNCSKSVIADEGLCRNNCLRRAQALECCGMTKGDVKVRLGRFKPFEALGLDGKVIEYDNPVLDCNFMDPAVAECLEDMSNRDSAGEICIPGTTLIKQTYTALLFKASKTGWYDTDTDNNKDGVPDEEEKSANILNHCIWNEANRTLVGGSIEPRHGKECTSDSDCTSSTKEVGRQGKCVKAYRAFCPMPCDYLRYRINRQTASPLSLAAIRAIVAQEPICGLPPGVGSTYLNTTAYANSTNMTFSTRRTLSFNMTYNQTSLTSNVTSATPSLTSNVTSNVTSNLTANVSSNVVGQSLPSQGPAPAPPSIDPIAQPQLAPHDDAKPLPCYNNSPSGRAARDADVRNNFAVVQIYYASTQQQVIEKDAAIDVVTLTGTLGGTLGLTNGMSLMTLVEFWEFGVFAVLCMPFFYFGKKLPWVRSVIKSEAVPLDFLDRDVAKVLAVAKEVYAQKAGEHKFIRDYLRPLGEMDWQQWQKIFGDRMNARTMRDLFDILDADGGGTLSEDEFMENLAKASGMHRHALAKALAEMGSVAKGHKAQQHEIRHGQMRIFTHAERTHNLRHHHFSPTRTTSK